MKFLTVALFLAAVQNLSAAENGLVGYWRFDSASGVITDLSGHKHNAQASNAKLIDDGGRKVLRLDGRQNIRVPSSPELNLQRGSTIIARVKFTKLTPGCQTIAHKDGQYFLRLNGEDEGGRLAFFPFVGGHWEPRVLAAAPTLNRWHHLVAIWDGANMFLWVDGLPYSAMRVGSQPPANNAPISLGNMHGAIDYLKIYRRALTSKEIVTDALGISTTAASADAPTTFDFTKPGSLEGWQSRSNATMKLTGNGLMVGSAEAASMILNNRLGANVDSRDFLSLRMSVDRGTQGTLIFVTTKGAGRIPFQVFPDQKQHSYVFDAWTWAGWGGNLLALGLTPSDAAGASAQIQSLEIAEKPLGLPEIAIHRIFTDATLAHAGRTEKIVARLQNTGGPAKNLTASLMAPRDVVVKGDAKQTIASLDHGQASELSWTVEASQAVAGDFRVSVTGEGVAEPVVGSQTIAFHTPVQAEKSSYVPVPVPAKTKYTLWTHYCALWKYGTHVGWKAIEPWPERKPVIGWYNEGTPEVADWQIKYMVEHGISGVIFCWYRTSINEPVKESLGHALEDGFLRARYLSMIKVGIMWENGCAKGVGSIDDLMKNVLPFWIDKYFTNPSYIRVNGKPLLYIWIPDNFRKQLGGSQEVRKALDLMRAECKRRGLGGLYVVACIPGKNKKAMETLAAEGWDATSAYNNGWRPPAEVSTVDNYTCAPIDGFIDQQESLWTFKRQLNLLPDITVATMGWDPRPWHQNGFFWSENTADKFRDLCLRAKKTIDATPKAGPDKNTVLFCCWNELGEGHYIEPTRGNGFSYLDVIRDVFCDGPKQHEDIAPEDVGLHSPDSWYRTACERAAAVKHGDDEPTAWAGDGLTAWMGGGGFDSIKIADGVLRGTTTNNDPSISLPATKLRARQFTKVVVEMRVDRRSSVAQLFWGTPTAGANEAASVTQKVIPDGQWHTYTFAVGKNPNWGGCIASLRFDPVAESGVTVEIKSIRLE